MNQRLNRATRWGLSTPKGRDHPDCVNRWKTFERSNWAKGRTFSMQLKLIFDPILPAEAGTL